MAGKKLLCTHQCNIPRTPTVSIASSKEQSHREASLSTTPSSEQDKTSLIFTIRGKIESDRQSIKKAWNSPFLEQQITEKSIRSYSVHPVHLEAGGMHISIERPFYLYFQEMILTLKKSDSLKEFLLVDLGPAARSSAAIGLCRRRQTSFAPLRVPRSSSAAQLDARRTATLGVLANPNSQSRLQGAHANPVGKGAVAMAPETLPNHPRPPGKRRPRADASLHGNLAGAPLPRFAGAPTHLPSKSLIKACFSPLSRPPLRFHTARSQAPRGLEVNAHLH
ncbi:LOW QUALITY PROTEIN: uncharacterized protein C12orf42 homolog [Saccopteryx leptura]|uniref:LOW QUALITY PROTEIN: uncharacterized protein C12orf42 homolog n=1 Tax=Saccopteryx leptura TaxID=249018 RepID=UPI00339BD6DD